MANDAPANGIVDLENAFGNDIRNPKFNRFLFLTYSLEEKMLGLLPKGSKAIVYYNKRASGRLRVTLDTVRIEDLENHAKIYCMWGSGNIKCWLGSFNLTENGLSKSIEWASSFEGRLLNSLEIEDVVNCTVQTSVSDNQVVNQTIDFISHLVNKETPVLSDRLFQANARGPTILHNVGSNTLRNCLIRITEKAKENLAITYITPFVTRGGIEVFSKLFHPKFSQGKITFHVVTNMPDSRTSTFLNSQAISDFKMKFKDFKMLKRKAGKGGVLLKDGTEINLNPIHLKLILIEFVNEKDEQESHTIFTSANLTEEAWGESPFGNSEIGVWLKDKSSNETIRKFIDNFKFCFSEPDQQELRKIDEVFDEVESKNKFEEFWMEDLIRKRLLVRKNELILDWNDSLPEIQNLDGILNFRNIVTREKLDENVAFKSKGDSYACDFKILSERKNFVLEYIKLTFDTNFEPPGFRVKKRFIADFTLSENGKRYVVAKNIRSDCNEVVVNDKKHRLENNRKLQLSTAEEIDSLSFSKIKSESEKSSIYIDVHEQPHLTGSFFENLAIRLLDFKSLGKFFEVTIKTNPFVDPPFDTIEFYASNHNRKEPAAFSKSDTTLNYYFFAQEMSGSELTAKVVMPYDRYFHEKETTLCFPETEKAAEVSYSWREAFGHKIIEMGSINYPINKLLSPSVNIQVYVQKHAQDLPSQQIKYLSKEDSLTYCEPLLYDLTIPIKCKEPYSRVIYRGVFEITIGDRVVQLLSPKHYFIIRDSAIRSFDLMEKEIPQALPWSRIKATDPVGWISVDSEKVQVSKEIKINRDSFELQVWKNGKRIEEREFRVLDHGKKWLIPILRKDLTKPLELLFVLQIGDEQFSDFASIFRARVYELVSYRHGFKLRRKIPPSSLPEDFLIRNEPAAKVPTIRLKTENLSPHKLDHLNWEEKKLFKISEESTILRLPSERDIVVCLSS